VVTSNQAVVWDCVSRLGAGGGGSCPGLLLAQSGAAALAHP